MFQRSNMFSEEDQKRINEEAQNYLKELEDKGPEQIFKAMLTWQVVHQSAMYEKIFEEQERMCLLLEEFLDIIYETDYILNEAIRNGDECISPLREPENISIRYADHHPLDLELSQ
jgi:hypothetical protein